MIKALHSGWSENSEGIKPFIMITLTLRFFDIEMNPRAD